MLTTRPYVRPLRTAILARNQYTYNQNSKAIIAEVRRSLEATVELLDSADAGRLGETLREWKLLNGSRSGGGGGGRA